MNRRTLGCILALLVFLPFSAQGQGTRTSIALGATWLDFSIGGVGAVAAQLRLNTGAIELSTLAVAPLGGVHAVPDCIPNAACFARSTPDVLVGAVVLLGRTLGTPVWRGSVGVGAFTAKGMEGPSSESRSSAAAAIGLDWTSARKSGLTPTLGLRAFGLAHAIGGMRYLIVPSIGVTF